MFSISELTFSQDKCDKYVHKIFLVSLDRSQGLFDVAQTGNAWVLYPRPEGSRVMCLSQEAPLSLSLRIAI